MYAAYYMSSSRKKSNELCSQLSCDKTTWRNIKRLTNNKQKRAFWSEFVWLTTPLYLRRGKWSSSLLYILYRSSQRLFIGNERKKIKTTMWVVENLFLYTILIILMSPQCVHLFLRIISLFSHFQRILYNTLSYLKCRFPLKRITCTNKEDFYPYFNRLNFKDEKRSRKLKIMLNTS